MLARIDNQLMQSINFEFLRSKWPDLAGLGGFAEAYAHSDAIGALGKLRTFCEQAAKTIHDALQLPRLYRPNLIDLLDDDSFKHGVPDVVRSKMHALRIEGNRALHGNKGDTTSALRLLKEAFDLARWMHVNFGGGSIDDCPKFTQPPQGGAEGTQRRREKRAILERVAAQEAQMQKLLEDLEQERARTETAQITTSELREQLATALEAGRHTASAIEAIDPLSFNEQETRRYLIDIMLADAGWDVGPGNKDTAEVGKEIEVAHQPTDSGIGYADYVLFDEQTAKPLAVVEAKKTATDAEEGRTQAKHYADGLEKEHGQRPIIFYTNGYDLWIWNDAEREPPRKICGFYSKDSLQHLHFQRSERKSLASISASDKIVDRPYQFEAVRRVVERFAEKRRKALVVQATGTGKTRMAIALCDALIRANWAKRVLFLCDRRELRKQAHNAFKEFLPSEPRTLVTADTADDRDKRIYIATYPAMSKIYTTFDVGFFDLIIADESHRSLYEEYRHLFQYFDCYQVGLTATPINEQTIESYYRNTFKMFGCDDLNPTVNYDFEEAINNNPPYLVPFVVDTHTTPFLRDGIKYSEMTDEQRSKLEEDEEAPEEIEYEQKQVDKKVFNKDTNRKIVRNLMEHGIRNADGSRIGKTIVFARNHNHAVLVQYVFDEMYPQYGGNFCRVIDNYDPRAESLIDDFKGVGTNPDLTVAISVDMLDTGIDVPPIVNLVFAKPVYSYVKFWQMIGRGTRLCKNLFGLDRDKTHFQIFDHWGNFERFDEGFQPSETKRPKSLMQLVFEARLALAKTAIEEQKDEALDLATDLIAKDIAALPQDTISVREKWRQVKTVAREDVLRQFDAAARAALQQDVAPLMQWCNISGHEAAYKFDRLIALMQSDLLTGSSRFNDHKDDLLNRVSSFFKRGEQKLRWSQFHHYGGEELLPHVRDEVFKHCRNLGNNSNGRNTFGEYMKDAQLMIQKASLLVSAVEMIDKLPLGQGDTKGDLYEYLLSKLTTAGINGQFRTPRHIIRMMVELIDPQPDWTIGDPACGTGGFLVATMEYLREKFTSPEGKLVEEVDGEEVVTYTGDLLEPYRQHIQSGMFHGFDFDVTMLRIAAMNLMLHNVDTPDIHYQDTLSNSFPERFPKYAEDGFDLIMANPPFKGSLDFSDVHPSLTGKVKTKKTELLFLVLMLRMLKLGGRCAVIVPDGVLFGSSKAHVALRRMLIDDHQLEAVVKLPAGVFKPYAGVSTAILLFTKGGQTDDVFFYDVQADGFSLDDKRDPIDENDLPDVCKQWAKWQSVSSPPRGERTKVKGAKKKFADRTAKAFFVPKKEIAGNKYDLSINRYKEIVYEEVEYDPPKVIIGRLKKLEKEIAKDLEELEAMLG